MMKPKFDEILVVALLLPLAAGCTQSHENGARPAATALASVAVRVARAEAKRHNATEETLGTVRAKLQARIEAKVAGRIVEMHATTGRPVKRGELLVKLDAQEIRARLDQALATRQQAAGDLKRFAALLERSAATPAEFDAAQARARVAEAAVSEAQAMLGYTEIAAPFDGVVTRKLADVGDLATPGKPLLEMEDPSHLRFETDVPEALIRAVQIGATLPVRLPDSPAELTATVSEIAPTADPGSRTFRVKLDLPPRADVRPGQFGRVAIPLEESTAICVPASAVVVRGQIEAVFVATNQQAQMRLVKTGKRRDGEVELASGLSAGESVVVENAAALRDGQPLEIKP